MLQALANAMIKESINGSLTQWLTDPGDECWNVWYDRHQVGRF